MKLVFCGGAREVGASCYLVQVEGKNVLLDSGIRMKGGQDTLPDFRQIQELGGVDAIVVSHAHLDHTGSLPVISREYPEAVLYMTHATKSLVRVLLYDSLKIMERSEAEIPIYAESHVDDMLGRSVCYSPQYAFKPFSDRDVEVTLFDAGHIAGAAMIYLTSAEGSLLYTGDFSSADQRTIHGASIPKLRPDVMITESTYGSYLHANRDLEEKRLVETVAEVIGREGKMLIPAFALGRAQELVLILKRAMDRGQLRPVPVYIDGMVRAINGAYRVNPNYLQRSLAKKAFRGESLFYDDHITAVETREQRQRVLDSDEPCCVISSSGMLKGGPSALYAAKLAGHERHYIAITGYQDEEAPGAELLALMDQEERALHLDGVRVPLRCGIGRYNLSAHADRGELLGLVHRVTPKRIFLVHGEERSIDALAEQMNLEARGQVFVPENGDSYPIVLSRQRKQLDFTHVALSPLNRPLGELDDGENWQSFWEYVYEHGGSRKGYTVEQLLYIWTGTAQPKQEDTDWMLQALHASQFFTANRRRLFLYHPAEPDTLTPASGPMELNAMLAHVKEQFPQDAGLYKTGAHVEETKVVLWFHFPHRAKREYATLLTQIEEATGWQVEVNDQCHTGAAEELAVSLLPAGAAVKKFSYYPHRRLFQLKLQDAVDGPEAIERQFQLQTGVSLEIVHPGQDDGSETLSLRPLDVEHAMEQNMAFEYVADVFAAEGVALYKKSRRVCKDGTAYLELSFITPVVGKRCLEQIRKLEDDTGWNITVSENPNQNELIKKAKHLLQQANVVIRKGPGVHAADAAVKVEVDELPDQELLCTLGREYMQQTGYSLEVLGRR